MTPGTSSSSASAPTAAPGAGGNSEPHLRRVLGLPDLIVYGLILLQPVGIAGSFGWATSKSHGHAATVILFGLVAIMFTAISYGRMCVLYPTAGSAYTYVGRGLNPYLGFLAGWAMFLDYVIIPIASMVFATYSLQRLIDGLAPNFTHQLVSALGFAGDAAYEQRVVFVILVTLLTIGITVLNYRGIKWTARTNEILMVIMCLMVVIFIVQAIRFLWNQDGWAALLSTEPFYNPQTFKLSTVATATSFAVMTYIGFDGMTTLAEDAKNPKRNLPLALVLVCVLIGCCAAFQAYLAQRIWPDYSTFKNFDTAFFDVCARVGGSFLFNAISLIIAVAMIGSSLSGQVGAARILFAMGRDNAIPKCFARLDKRANPSMNILWLGALTLAGTYWLDWEMGVEVSNFGAFLGFIGVNLAVIREYYFRPPVGHHRNWFWDILSPSLGFLFCAAILVSLPPRSRIVGLIWFALGLAYTAWKTRFFRRPPTMVDLTENYSPTGKETT